MIHTYVQKKGKLLYRYYVCINAHQRGWNKCETRSVSAPVLEGAVVLQLRGIARNPAMLSAVLRQIENQRQASRSGLGDEKTRLEAELKQLSAEIGRTSKLAGGRGAQAKTAADGLA